MGGDLIEQQDRRNARHGADEAGVRQHEVDEQRLLFAGRGFARGDSFGAMRDQEVREMDDDLPDIASELGDTLLNTTSDAILAADRQGVIRFWNDAVFYNPLSFLITN